MDLIIRLIVLCLLFSLLGNLLTAERLIDRLESDGAQVSGTVGSDVPQVTEADLGNKLITLFFSLKL
jgi:hypothetical protein